MYVLEAYNQISIIDAGLMIPVIDILGIDAVISEISYLRDILNQFLYETKRRPIILPIIMGA
jgi:mRNA degradation ribonuclease J1/J2